MTNFRHSDGVTTTQNLITAAQAAKKFGVTPVTIHRWIRSGRLPARKLPGGTGAYLIDERDAEQFARTA